MRRKFSRKRDQRKALRKALLNSFFKKEKMQTTLAKAKETAALAEKIITKAKKGDLASRRLILKELNPSVVDKLFKDIAQRYKDREAGYTRVIKLGQRKSDGAKMAIIELV